MNVLKPQDVVPPLTVLTTGGKKWTLNEQNPQKFTMLVFYRGYHCPICKKSLRYLHRYLNDFENKGVHPVAISVDSHEKARVTEAEWELEGLTIGCELPIDRARDWGLFISKAINQEEPEEFTEPGIFLIDPKGVLYAVFLQSLPFARNHFEDLLNSMATIVDGDFPARGAD